MPKYLLIDSQTVRIPGDERSQRYPGHGYPERTETYPKLKWFDSDEDLISYMETWGKDIEDPMIYEVGQRVKLERKTSVSVVKK